MEVNWDPQERLVHGPTKYELVLGLFSREPVTFRCETGQDFSVTVNSVLAEDGSTESWIIEGYVIGQDSRRFYAYWHTRSRDGYLKLEQRVKVQA